jgi:hypothetical protein
MQTLKSIDDNLNRQHKGLRRLLSLLREEYQGLTRTGETELAANQLAIQELMRQLAQEREALAELLPRDIPEGGRLEAYLLRLPRSKQESLRTLVADIERQEKLCSEQANRNADLSMALVAQSRQLIEYMQEQVSPAGSGMYGKNGLKDTARPDGALVQGRL